MYQPAREWFNQSEYDLMILVEDQVNGFITDETLARLLFEQTVF